MIVNYPMLVSDTISPGIIPGICKLIERYILVYEMDSVVDSVQQKITKAAVFTGHTVALVTAAAVADKMAGGHIASLASKHLVPAIKSLTGKRESEDVLNLDLPDLINEAGYNISSTIGGTPTYKNGESTPIPEGKIKKDIKATKFSIDLPNAESISLEPTWMSIDAGDMGTKIIGIKVIPFPVKANGDIASLMLNDRNLSPMKSMMTGLGRKAIRLFLAFSKAMRLPYITNKFLSGDVKKDIIWASSKYGSRTFLLMNFAEIHNDRFFEDMGGFSKLQKLGWGSVIMADDINRRGIFCMKEFKGSCSVLPYQYIYAGLGKSGKEYLKIYDDIEDVRKSASPFFQLKGSRNKFVGESLGMKKLEEYRKCYKGK